MTIHRRDPSVWAAARIVGSVAHHLTTQLSAASNAEQVECCLRTAIDLLSAPIDRIHAGCAPTLTLAASEASSTRGALRQQYLSQLEPHAAAVGWATLRKLFLLDQFNAWTTCVLAVAAGDWLPKLQGADRDSLLHLIQHTLMAPPAWNVLAALSGHLSSVSPHSLAGSSSSSSSSSSTVTALAADTAAQLLLQRFLAAGSTGLVELLGACDSRTAAQASSTGHVLHHHKEQQQQGLPAQPGLDRQLQDAQPAAQPSAASSELEEQQQKLSRSQVEEAAALLAALPERLHVLQPALPQLPQQPAVISALLRPCITFVAAALQAQAAAAGLTHCKYHHADQTPNSSSPSAAASSNSNCEQCCSKVVFAEPCVVPGALQLVAALLQKLVTRGYASAAAGVVLDMACQGHAATNSCCSSSKDRAFTTTAAATKPGLQQGASRSHESPEQQRQQQQQEEVTDDTVQPTEWYIPALHLVLLVMLRQQPAVTAVQKLVVRLLRAAAGNTPLQQSSQQQLEQPEQLLLQRQPEEALVALLCPLLQVSAQVRSIALQRLLLAQTLPSSALQLLLRLLSACRPSMLPEAAGALAQSWCDSSTILQVPVAQQAYMTAALTACIQQLPRELLDPASSVAAAGAGAASAVQVPAAVQQELQLCPYQGIQPDQTSGLLRCIVQGVSARLASPSPAIRLQAMRVGRAFAEKLGPSKPMFEDAGPLELMQEECWPGAAAANARAPDQQQVQRQERQGNPVKPQPQKPPQSNCTADSSSSSFTALARLAEATDGPDSDDDDAADDNGRDSLHAEPVADKQLPAVIATFSAADGAVAGVDSIPAAGAGAASGTSGADGDWDAASMSGSSEGSVDSLVAYDLQEDLGAEQWWGPDGLGPTDSNALGLRAVSAALRKQDDMAGALEALRKVEVLVRAQPDELAVVAPELARSLVHCKVPVWADSPAAQHSKPSDTQGGQPHTPLNTSSSAEVQRRRALVAVLALSPLTSGDTVIAELYSPNLDTHQRMLILDGLAAAAAEMSDPRKAPQLALQGTHKVPTLLPPEDNGRNNHGLLDAQQQQQQQSIEDATAVSASSGTSTSSSFRPVTCAVAAPGLVQSSSRVWGKVSLQKQAQSAANHSSRSKQTFRNRFSPVALRWATALLQQCDVKQQGIDLFGRDSLLLGRLLVVLGSFVEAAAETPAAVPLCAGLLELLKAQEVSRHREAFVRRSALVAASQVVRHLPAARLAGAMVGRKADLQDAVLVERLQWLLSWAQQVAAGDVDQHCRLLAAGCVAWHVELAEGAMAVLQHLPEPQGPSLAAAAAGKRAVGGKQQEIQVQLPSLERLVLS